MQLCEINSVWWVQYLLQITFCKNYWIQKEIPSCLPIYRYKELGKCSTTRHIYVLKFRYIRPIRIQLGQHRRITRRLTAIEPGPSTQESWKTIKATNCVGIKLPRKAFCFCQTGMFSVRCLFDVVICGHPTVTSIDTKQCFTHILTRLLNNLFTFLVFIVTKVITVINIIPLKDKIHPLINKTRATIHEAKY